MSINSDLIDNTNPCPSWAVSDKAKQDNDVVNQNQPLMPMLPSTSSSINSYAFMGIQGGNVHDAVGMVNSYQYSSLPAQEIAFSSPVKAVISLKNCVLCPPNPNAPPRMTRDRPLGCKTILVSGLPEKADEEIIAEIFVKCGKIKSIRMARKRLCRIRFFDESSVENALYFSGYNIIIDNRDEAFFRGKLHVDYARNREDQFEFERKQRALQHKVRHKIEDYCRPRTPVTVHYCDREGFLVREKLKDENSVTEAIATLTSWLEKGECTKKNADYFFSTMQSIHSHAKKLELDKFNHEKQLYAVKVISEKHLNEARELFEKQLNEAKDMYKKQQINILQQLTESEKMYKAASLQKCWDQFTKAQRKNIEMWKNETKKFNNDLMEEVINEREEEEMELSEDEDDKNNTSADIEQLKEKFNEDISKLQKLSDSFKCQLEDAQNKMMVMESNYKQELKNRDHQIENLFKTLEDSKQESLDLSQKCANHETKLKEYELMIQLLKIMYNDNDSE